jgi:drug/metabolite transporter (DMT)-like permease
MRRGTLLVLSTAFLWGTTFPATRFGLEDGNLEPYSFLYYRFAVATLALLAYALPARRVDWSMFADWRLVGLGLINALGYLLQYAAQDRTTASKTSLLVNVNVLITAILAYYLLRERLAASTGVGAVLGVLGVFLLTSNGDLASLRFSNSEFVGDLMAFGTGMCWTVYILTMKHYFTKHPHSDVIAVTVVLFVTTLFVLFPIALFTEGLEYRGNLEGLGAIAYLSVFPTVVALWAYQVGLKTTSAAVSSVLLLFETVVAVALSVMFLSERMTGWTGVGAALTLVATYLVSKAPGPDSPMQTTPAAVEIAETQQKDLQP